MFDTFPEGIAVALGVVIFIVLIYYLYKHETGCRKNADCKDSTKPLCLTKGPYKGQCTSAGNSGLCCVSSDGTGIAGDTNCGATDTHAASACTSGGCYGNISNPFKNDGCTTNGDCTTSGASGVARYCVTDGPFKGYCTGPNGIGLCCVSEDGSPQLNNCGATDGTPSTEACDDM